MKGPERGRGLSAVRSSVRWVDEANARMLTGPTRSGITATSRATLPRMKKNPRRVTMFGASHSGSSSTKAFHCETPVLSTSTKPGHSKARQRDELPRRRPSGGVVVGRAAIYIWSENVVRDRRLVDAGVLVALEVYEGIVRDAFRDRLLCVVVAIPGISGEASGVCGQGSRVC